MFPLRDSNLDDSGHNSMYKPPHYSGMFHQGKQFLVFSPDNHGQNIWNKEENLIFFDCSTPLSIYKGDFSIFSQRSNILCPWLSERKFARALHQVWRKMAIFWSFFFFTKLRYISTPKHPRTFSKYFEAWYSHIGSIIRYRKILFGP